MKKYLVIALILGFTFIAFVAFLKAKPTAKAPIYEKINAYSPYYIDKRFGGLQIMSKTDEKFKEKPTNMEVFHRLDFLNQEWGKTHIKIVENQVIITDNNGTEITKLPITTQKDSDFMHSFYGI